MKTATEMSLESKTSNITALSLDFNNNTKNSILKNSGALFASFPKLSLCRTLQHQQSQQESVDAKNELNEDIRVNKSAQELKNNSNNNVLLPTTIDLQKAISNRTKTVEQIKKPALLSIRNVPDNDRILCPKNLSVFNETQAINMSLPNEQTMPLKKNDERNLILGSLSSVQNKCDELPSNNHVPSLLVPKYSQEKIKSSLQSPITQSSPFYSDINFPTSVSCTPLSSMMNNQQQQSKRVSKPNIVNTTSNSRIQILNYAVEHCLDDLTYDVAEEFKSFIANNSPKSSSQSETTQSENVTAYGEQESMEMNDGEADNVCLTHEVEFCNKTKWYISELRINRQPIYRTYWTNSRGKKKYHSINRKLSNSVNDLKYFISSNCLHNKNATSNDGIIQQPTHSSLSLQNYDLLRSESTAVDNCDRRKSEDNISCPNTNLQTHTNYKDFQTCYVQNENSKRSNNIYLTDIVEQKNNLITNELVKKKLLDILNDDELENACIEDLDYEFEKISLSTGFCSTTDEQLSSDDALYYSPDTDNHLKYNTISMSYDAGLSSSNYAVTDSRLHRTKSDNQHTEVNMSKTNFNNKTMNIPSWYSSPLPHWRTDDSELYNNTNVNINNVATSFGMVAEQCMRKRSDSITMIISSTDDSTDHINQVNDDDVADCKISSKLIRTVQYGIKENKRKQRYRHHRRNEQYKLVSKQNTLPLHTNSTSQRKSNATICI
ncbi:unnamed protein product [Didymodactylos carnosus]|uniref:Uncharacterized protein n=1 Tax=Didymodactylos carnosus TaxID=1234261 RepID=A0A813WVW1_9BILA|nr:unnamed protein product [Didymodactylos carnosus]CAF0856241.1 unnamed protein product [Didymodactylos carnosus]CAF3504207.1 unnamed protein product [Didymodactylos carnosus]CAF3644008.1 unnamed protein product [Didymodactylos carnosus]